MVHVLVFLFLEHQAYCTGKMPADADKYTRVIYSLSSFQRIPELSSPYLPDTAESSCGLSAAENTTMLPDREAGAGKS